MCTFLLLPEVDLYIMFSFSESFLFSILCFVRLIIFVRALFFSVCSNFMARVKSNIYNISLLFWVFGKCNTSPFFGIVEFYSFLPNRCQNKAQVSGEKSSFLTRKKSFLLTSIFVCILNVLKATLYLSSCSIYDDWLVIDKAIDNTKWRDLDSHLSLSQPQTRLVSAALSFYKRGGQSREFF